MPVFGNRPDDVMQDKAGNAQSGVSIVLYATQSDAQTQVSPLGTATTDSNGRWPITLSGNQVWARDPAGNVWAVASEDAISTQDARLTAAEATLAAVPTTYASKTLMGTRTPAYANDFSSLQDAATIAASDGTRLVAGGTISTSSTLLLTSDADLSQLTINYSGTGVAVQIGDPTSLLFRKDIRLPVIIATAKTTTGWGQVAGSAGVRISNAYSCFIRVPRVANFEVGVLGHGQSPNGTSYCTIELGHLDNCKQGFKIAPQSTGTTAGDKTTSGWFNQNTIIGGRISHNSNEGVQVTGTRNVVIAACGNSVNNNVFINTSLESPDVVEYHGEIFGQYNKFKDCRYENTGGDAHRRWWWRSDGNAAGTAKGNVIDGGFNAGQITEVWDVGAGANDIRSDVFNRFTGGSATQAVTVVENLNSSASPVRYVMPAGATAAGTAPSTGYCVKESANSYNGKRTGDANDRLVVDWQNATVKGGDGTGAPGPSIGFTASAVTIGGSAPFLPVANGSQDLGSAAARFRRAWVNNYVRPHASKTANYTLVADVDGIVTYNGTSLTATLPDPTAVQVGSVYSVKNVNSTALTVNSAGTSKTLDGAASQSLAQWAKGSWYSDGAQWLSI